MRDDGALWPGTKQAHGFQQSVKEENDECDQWHQADRIVSDLSRSEYLVAEMNRAAQPCGVARVGNDEFALQQEKIACDNARKVRDQPQSCPQTGILRAEQSYISCRHPQTNHQQHWDFKVPPCGRQTYGARPGERRRSRMQKDWPRNK